VVLGAPRFRLLDVGGRTDSHDRNRPFGSFDFVAKRAVTVSVQHEVGADIRENGAEVR